MANTRTVLIADGNPGTIPDISSRLAALGCNVVTVGDADFVLTMAMRQTPSLVILGARLPVDGLFGPERHPHLAPLSALRRLRASVHCASIPVIAVAAPGAQKQALLTTGAEECLEPPVQEDDLLAAVQRLLGLSRAVTGAPAEILGDPERLLALSETGLLDSESDQAFDVVTRLAARVLGVPVALVSLVDDTRQFFKSQIGLPAPWDERRQTPLSHSFCQWVVSGQEELVVDDARLHPVLSENRAVHELGVVAYAGVPLSAITGHPIGSFCAIDVEPREWTNEELAALRNFAQLIGAQAALSQAPTSLRRSEARARQLLDVTQAAGRGFLSAASLLRRDRPPLTSEQRRDLIGIIERHSHQLVELAADASSSDAYDPRNKPQLLER